jgi:hypothetical protein
VQCMVLVADIQVVALSFLDISSGGGIEIEKGTDGASKFGIASLS